MTDTSTRDRLRDALARRRLRQQRAEAGARSQLQADEQAITGPTRSRMGLGDAWLQFCHHASPWIIGGMLLAAVVARTAVGGFRATDLLVPAVMLASFPLVEWLVHVFILHLRPRAFGPVRIDPLLSRKHRAHHADPRDLPLVFIPWPVLLWLLPLHVGIALLAFPRVATGLTYLVTLGLLGMAYEWTHYLIHSDYPPRSGVYKAIWRNHRLHHYKNENYWFTVTTAGTADRLLRTNPDPASVATSPTARNLHGMA